MRVKILACETLRDEVMYVLQKCELDYDVIWIESGLHNYPKKLHRVTQEALNSIENCDRLMIAMGRCGNAMDHIVSGTFETILPRVDDCISLLFGSDQERQRYARENAAYYLTEGWMRGERNIWIEYQYIMDRYGEEMGKEITESMFGNYRTLALLDTGVKPINNLYVETEKIETAMNLNRKIVPATLNYLQELFVGPWTEEKYYILAPGEELHVY